MKKIILSILSSVLLLGLFACSTQNGQGNNEQSDKVVKDGDVRKIVWKQLSSEQKEWIDGTWSDGKVSKITLNENMMAMIDDKSYEGKEVFLIDFPTKSKSIPNNMVVYADTVTFDYIGNGLVD